LGGRMSSEILLTLMAAALLVLCAGCDMRIGLDPVDRSVEESCMDEGIDPETTEYEDCVKELSEPD
jgi:hypothetical protein